MSGRDIGEALRTYIQRATDEREARNKYDGYSWGWHGAALIGEVRDAEKALTDALDTYIDGRVAKALQA
jgi:hypothetical protein